MNIGMLWFDNDKNETINEKIKRAANYYKKKYGKSPTLCFVHPSMLPTIAYMKNNVIDTKPDDQKKKKPYFAGNIEVKLNQSVLPNHFWIGINGNS